jgi:hypothetical protein
MSADNAPSSDPHEWTQDQVHVFAEAAWNEIGFE